MTEVTCVRKCGVSIEIQGRRRRVEERMELVKVMASSAAIDKRMAMTITGASSDDGK
jgi:hypothetical protein